MFRRFQMRYLSMQLPQKAARIAVRIALLGVIAFTGCQGESRHNCTGCGLGMFRIVVVAFPNGQYQQGQADAGGCLTVSTTADCSQVVFIPI